MANWSGLTRRHLVARESGHLFEAFHVVLDGDPFGDLGTGLVLDEQRFEDQPKLGPLVFYERMYEIDDRQWSGRQNFDLDARGITFGELEAYDAEVSGSRLDGRFLTDDVQRALWGDPDPELAGAVARGARWITCEMRQELDGWASELLALLCVDVEAPISGQVADLRERLPLKVAPTLTMFDPHLVRPFFGMPELFRVDARELMTPDEYVALHWNSPVG